MQMVGPTCVASVTALLLVCAHSQQMPDEAPEDPEFQIGFDPSALMTANVSYTDGTAALKGYLAYDNTTTGPRPGVIILPDWDGASASRRSGVLHSPRVFSRSTCAGIGPYEEWRAHLLATLGYTGG